MDSSAGQITALLKEASTGCKEAEERLMVAVYAELKKMARRYVVREHTGHTLQPTALVHEAYLKLVDQKGIEFQSRSQFFVVAGQVMRHILVDYARQANAQKRGGERQKVSLDDFLASTGEHSLHVLAVNEALQKLEKLDPRQCRVVELRFFAGLSLEETAAVLQLSSRTVKREWRSAKAWLYSELALTAEARSSASGDHHR